MRIDLHTHSTFSDGTDTPAQLVAAARAAGLDVVGLMDHDTTAGWQEAAQAARAAGVRLVRGTEISTMWQGRSVHLLSLLQDPTEPGLAQLLHRNQTSRERRARQMVERLAADYPITWQDVAARAGNPQTVGRPHMADALVAAGVFPDRDAAFAGPLSGRGPYYVRLDVPDPVDAVAAVRAAGGVPVLAHPFAAVRGPVLPDDVVRAMAAAGLAALEADHRDHDPAARAHARALAAQLGLPVTGSSDYHGTGKPNRLGENLTAPEVFEALVAQGAVAVV